MQATPNPDHNPAAYFVLVAPAVAFFLALGSRQARISTIVRDNAKQIVDVKSETRDRDRIQNLLRQNSLLLSRYCLIQCALIILCAMLAVLGWIALGHLNPLEDFLRGGVWIGRSAIGLGTLSILYEIVRSADTLKHEIDFAEYKAGGENKDCPGMESFAMFPLLASELKALIGYLRRRGLRAAGLKKGRN